MNSKTTVNEWLRGIAGALVLLSLALGWFVHPGFFLFTAFVGANLLQSMFTKWCFMMWLLRRLGVPEEPEAAAAQS
jgi:Inner membrane protein YgaP-like, transmembrane domain